MLLCFVPKSVFGKQLEEFLRKLMKYPNFQRQTPENKSIVPSMHQLNHLRNTILENRQIRQENTHFFL
jgi:hypothetical protein